MLKYSKLAVLALLGAIATGTAYAESKSVATVNGAAIPQARLDMRIKSAMAQGQPDSPDLRNAVRDELINIEVLAQAANKKV
jgi:peptidyl-prolyl cis-trans isomerase C